MEIKLTKQESEDFFYSALCNGLGTFCSACGGSLEFDSAAYREARLRISSDMGEGNPCYEDVLMAMLRNGCTMRFEDTESDGEYSRVIGIDDVHERVSMTPAKHLVDMLNETDDAITANAILQTVFFKEIVF